MMKLSNPFQKVSHGLPNEKVVFADAQGKISWVSQSFAKFWRCEEAELLGIDLGQVLKSQITEIEASRELENAFKKAEPVFLKVENVLDPGTRNVMSISIYPVRSEDNKLAGYLAIERNLTTEISDRHEVKQMAKLRKAWDQIGLTVVTNHEGTIIRASRQFEEVVGYSVGELVGQHMSILRSELHPEEFYSGNWEVIRKGEVLKTKYCAKRKNGDPVWLDVAAILAEPVDESSPLVVFSFRDMTLEISAQETIRREREVDALTGLPNRAGLRGALKRSIEETLERMNPTGGAYCLMNIDNFKKINETHGYRFGDLVLQEIAKRLSLVVSGNNSVSRVGPDEFGVIFSDSMPFGKFDSVIVELKEAVETEIKILDHVILPSVSIGSSRFPEDAQSVDSLMMNAEIALFQAKLFGNGHSRKFSTSARLEAQRSDYLRRSVLTAIETQSFDVAFQPIICVDTLKHRGFEVLARLDDAGISISPADFIPVAEKFGLIRDVGHEIVKKMLSVVQEMESKGLKTGSLSFNCSAVELRDAGYVKDLLKTLESANFEKSMFTVELTETAFLGPTFDDIAARLSDLRSSGIKVSLDDFGTGYSTLSQLLNLTVDFIKIDKSFAPGLVGGRSKSLLNGLSKIAKDIGIQIVVEGIENRPQFDSLRGLGCHFCQGYWIKKPIPVPELENYLRSIEV